MAIGAQGIQGGTDFDIALEASDQGGLEVVELGIVVGTTATKLPADVTKGLSVLVTNLTASAATETNVNDTASDTQLLASNASRKYFSIHNDSASTLYVRWSGSAASATAFNIKMLPDSFYESGAFCYTGEIRGIWSADASGAARICEA